MPNSKVLLLGASGQDGPFLAEMFATFGCEVTCWSKNYSARISKLRINQIIKPISLKSGIKNQICELQPDIIVNLVSKSSVAYCEENPSESKKINYELVQKLVSDSEIYANDTNLPIKFVQASSSEMFGNTDAPCTEESAKLPNSTYGRHKLLAHEFLMSKNIESKNIDFKSVILFNHESEFRSDQFVSAKVARAAAEVMLRGKTTIEFGDINSQRDWGYAKDYMNAVTCISLFGKSDTYIVASGKLHSIEEMLKIAFNHIGLDEYSGYVKTNEIFKRQKQTPPLVGDSSKLRGELNWEPKVTFREMITRMVDFHVKRIKTGTHES